MTSNLKTLLVLFLMSIVLVDAVKLRWCFSKTIKTYTKTITVPRQKCRFVNVRNDPLRERSQADPKLRRPQENSLVDNRQTAEELMKLFPGLFLNATVVTELNKELEKSNRSKKPGILPGKKPDIRPSIVGPVPPIERGVLTGTHDGDLHCPTYRGLVKAPDRLQNVQKENRDIVHFDSMDVFQYIHKGTCGASTQQSCSNGGCFQERSIVYLMVWKDNPDWPTGFEPFEVDSYCSCKGITP